MDWDYKINILGLPISLYIAWYWKNVYSKKENKEEEKWKAEKTMFYYRFMMLHANLQFFITSVFISPCLVFEKLNSQMKQPSL